MRKILAGFLVALVVGVPALYFGIPWWAEQKALRELDATLDMLRRTGATASRGAASYDFWKRTLKVADLVIHSGNSAGGSLKIRELTAFGIANVDASKFSADRIEVVDADVAGLKLGEASSAQTYSVPQLTAEKVTGPLAFTPKPAAIDGADEVLAALSTFAALSARKVAAPVLKISAVPPAAGPATAEAMEYILNDVTLDTMTGGQVRSATVSRLTVEGRLPDSSAVAGSVEKVELSELDATPLIAALDKTDPKDDGFHRIYRRAATGPYKISVGASQVVGADSILVEDFAIRPRKIVDPTFIALAETIRKQPVPALSPAETAALLEKLADVYEALRLGKLEVRGVVADFAAQAPVKIGTVRMAALDAGKIGEISVDNLSAESPSGSPASLGRFAFKGIDVVKLMRLSASLGNTSAGLEQGLALLSTVEGLELRDFRGTERTTMQPLVVDSLDVSWGNFIGSIPSRIRAATRFTAVVDPNGSDPNLRYLLDAGIRDVTVDLNIGAAWSEPTKAIALSPLNLTFAKVVGITAAGSLLNVSDTAFSPNPLLFGMAAAQIDAGPLEITLRDLGITDLIAAQLARDQGTTPDVMRTRLVDMIRTFAMASPELEGIGTALARLVETRASTLTVKLVPKARVNLLQAAEIAQTDPLSFLAQFTVEASTDR